VDAAAGAVADPWRRRRILGRGARAPRSPEPAAPASDIGCGCFRAGRRPHDRRARPARKRGHSRTEVTATASTSCSVSTVSGSMQALRLLIDGHRVNRIQVVKVRGGEVHRGAPERPQSASSPLPPLRTWSARFTLDHDWLLQNLERGQHRRGRRMTGHGHRSAIAASVNRLPPPRQIQSRDFAHGRHEQHRQK